MANKENKGTISGTVKETKEGKIQGTVKENK